MTMPILFLGVVLVLYFITGTISGIPVFSTSSGGSSNTCPSCGRIYSAGDSGGNFLNIAGSGLCNNCESNYHSMKQFIGQ